MLPEKASKGNCGTYVLRLGTAQVKWMARVLSKEQDALMEGLKGNKVQVRLRPLCNVSRKKLEALILSLSPVEMATRRVPTFL